MNGAMLWRSRWRRGWLSDLGIRCQKIAICRSYLIFHGKRLPRICGKKFQARSRRSCAQEDHTDYGNVGRAIFTPVLTGASRYYPGPRTVPVRCTWTDRAALQKLSVFGPDYPLRTGTV